MFKTSMVSRMADVKLALNLYTILCEIVYLFNTTASVESTHRLCTLI